MYNTDLVKLFSIGWIVEVEVEAGVEAERYIITNIVTMIGTLAGMTGPSTVGTDAGTGGKAGRVTSMKVTRTGSPDRTTTPKVMMFHLMFNQKRESAWSVIADELCGICCL